ncbi:hypothetical protein B6S09_17360 [Oceanimonas baumannii]|uniref:Uncharacterized protein n=1 Tax=Oceanimonas baumannii TaxID=129578 RepID=A0A235C9L1_9GAMM|nr:hypothetical protein B6S09_17360 [Oceanimonas baumannii]
MQHHGAVFTNGVEHDRVIGLGHHFPHNVNTFGFQPLQVGKVHSDDCVKKLCRYDTTSLELN